MKRTCQSNNHKRHVYSWLYGIFATTYRNKKSLHLDLGFYILDQFFAQRQVGTRPWNMNILKEDPAFLLSLEFVPPLFHCKIIYSPSLCLPLGGKKNYERIKGGSVDLQYRSLVEELSLLKTTTKRGVFLMHSCSVRMPIKMFSPRLANYPPPIYPFPPPPNK
jgi:hypothetical protein